MKVLGLIASPSDPASRFRILQYAPYLKTEDVLVEGHYYLPAKDASPAPWTKELEKLIGINPWRSWNIAQELTRLPLLMQQFDYDLVWQSRMLLPYRFRAEQAITIPQVLDIDDAVWMFEGEERLGRALRASSTVFAGNEYLADWARKYRNNVVLIPSTIDTAQYFPVAAPPSAFTIGWIGTPSNFKYLELVAAPLQDFLRKYADARFLLISSSAPSFIPFDGDRLQFRLWKVEKENDWINEFSVGIMPLTDDEWTRGKCGFKLLQYMACGKPVIASPVGINASLLEGSGGLAATDTTSWFQAFETLYHQPQARTEMGVKGRALVEAAYNTRKWSAEIAAQFRKLKG